VADGAVRVDGRLDEPVWRKEHFGAEGRIGALAGAPRSVQPELLVTYDTGGLYLAIRVKDPEEKRCRFDLTLCRLFSIPTEQSYRYHIAYSGGNIVDSHLMYHQREESWTCPWKIATDESNGVWSAEIGIPFSNVMPEINPGPGSVWRFNLALFRAGDDLDAPPLARWGYPDLDRVAHGAALVFGATTDEWTGPTEADK
jgi:hypothetical protein